MKLQADPTVAYAASGGSGVLDHRLNRADLDSDDPYNTYKRMGLPPGPICSPGVASLRAVARPSNSEDLYFVADGSGGHAFAKTVAAHNCAMWRSGAAHRRRSGAWNLAVPAANAVPANVMAARKQAAGRPCGADADGELTRSRAERRGRRATIPRLSFGLRIVRVRRYDAQRQLRLEHGEYRSDHSL